MQQIDQIHDAKMLLNANLIAHLDNDALIKAFTDLGPSAHARLKREGVLKTLNEVEDLFMSEVFVGGGKRQRISEDAIQEEMSAWVDKEYRQIGKSYIHIYDMHALSAVIFDMSIDWSVANGKKGSVVEALKVFISKKELVMTLAPYTKSKKANTITQM